MRLYNLKSNEQCLLTFCYSTYLLYEFLFLGITDANCLNYAFVYLVKEWSDQLNQFSSRHHLLIEENKTPQEVLIHLPALQRLPNLIEERELREGSVLPGFGEAHVLEHPQPRSPLGGRGVIVGEALTRDHDGLRGIVIGRLGQELTELCKKIFLVLE